MKYLFIIFLVLIVHYPSSCFIFLGALPLNNNTIAIDCRNKAGKRFNYIIKIMSFSTAQSIEYKRNISDDFRIERRGL